MIVQQDENGNVFMMPTVLVRSQENNWPCIYTACCRYQICTDATYVYDMMVVVNDVWEMNGKKCCSMLVAAKT